MHSSDNTAFISAQPCHPTLYALLQFLPIRARDDLFLTLALTHFNYTSLQIEQSGAIEGFCRLYPGEFIFL